MELIICDISALLYWRTPPVVRLLAGAPEDDGLLRSLVAPSRLSRLRTELEEMGARFSLPRSARYGAETSSLLEENRLLSSSVTVPVDLLVSSPDERRPSVLCRPRLWSAPLAAGSTRRVSPGLLVTSPLLTLQQLAARSTLTRAVMLASELCGTFSVYEPPSPLAALLQELCNEGRLSLLGGWRPALDENGQLTDLWSRPALLKIPKALGDLSASSASRGRARLIEALKLTVPRAASPLEVRSGMLLGLPTCRGGEGYARFVHNQRIVLSPEVRLIARRSSCFCDLFWGRLDLECHSARFHSGRTSTLSDADRADALELMGIEVEFATHGQIVSPERFAALSHLVADKLGQEVPRKTALQQRRTCELRDELFTSWAELPLCKRRGLARRHVTAAPLLFRKS